MTCGRSALSLDRRYSRYWSQGSFVLTVSSMLRMKGGSPPVMNWVSGIGWPVAIMFCASRLASPTAG